ncbi:hypothetical protein ZIOFF_039665 [Zingiber officinale]|uniref:Uncharacterized protein n=1 Tax=Zingiber officinale TaxID=94328 RepID=A0A8J5G4X4_ZINOF|nr:hypothetical protein ZIOFF_039665 [Zingiber officinale]
MVWSLDSSKRRADSTPHSAPPPPAMKLEVEEPLDEKHVRLHKRARDVSTSYEQALYNNVLGEPGPLGLRPRTTLISPSRGRRPWDIHNCTISSECKCLSLRNKDRYRKHLLSWIGKQSYDILRAGKTPLFVSSDSHISFSKMSSQESIPSLFLRAPPITFTAKGKPLHLPTIFLPRSSRCGCRLLSAPPQVTLLNNGQHTSNGKQFKSRGHLVSIILATG